jgi:hypothetical protein
MPFTLKKNKSQEKMYVVVDLNHAGPKLLNQLHAGIQEKKDKYVLRYQPLDTSYALIYFKNKDQTLNLAPIKNKQVLDGHRKNIKNILLQSVQRCTQYREFSSNRSYVDALRNIKDLANRENQDINIGELKQSLKNISDVVTNPLRRNKLAEIKEKNKIQQSNSPNFKELFYLHLERFLHMDGIENKNLEMSIFDNLTDEKNHSRLKTKEEIQSMQKFIQRVVYLDALSEPKLLNLFERSKWKIEIESFCHKWLKVTNPNSTFVNRQKLQLFGWRSEMDWIAKKISNRNDGLSIKNLTSPSISPLGREKFKPDSTKNKNPFERKNVSATHSGNQIYKKIDFSSLIDEESSIVESSDQSTKSNI